TEVSWTVIGYGAIGQLVGRALIKSGVSVAYKTRQESLQTHFNNYHSDVVFVAVKAYDVAPFITEWRRTETQTHQQPLLFMSYNGMLTAETQLFDKLPYASLVTTHGAFLEHGELIHAGHGEIWGGPLHNGNSQQQAHYHQALGLLDSSLPPVYAEPNIEKRRWLKLAINCLINPLTAIHNVRNGELLKPNFIALQHQLAREFVDVADAHGHVFSAEELVSSAQRVCETTANNYSSMWQDHQRGRRTEIDYLNGFIALEG